MPLNVLGDAKFITTSPITQKIAIVAAPICITLPILPIPPEMRGSPASPRQSLNPVSLLSSIRVLKLKGDDFGKDYRALPNISNL